MTPDAALFPLALVAALVAAALIFMWDTARSTRCKQCPHCQSLIEKERRDNAWAAHKAWHTHTTNVPGCEFCDVRGKQE